MATYLRQIVNTFNQLKYSERKLTVLTLCSLILVLFYFMNWVDVFNDWQKTRQQTATIEQSIFDIQLQIEHTMKVADEDPNLNLSLELKSLLEGLNKQDEQILQLSEKLLNTEQMQELLSALLSDKDIRILGIANGEAMPIKLVEDASSAPLFKHEINIEIEGKYQNVVSYLQRLEENSWKFEWDNLRFTFTNSDQGRLNVRLYALSTQEYVIDL